MVIKCTIVTWVWSILSDKITFWHVLYYGSNSIPPYTTYSVVIFNSGLLSDISGSMVFNYFMST